MEKGDSYPSRNAVLKALGFRTYDQYLGSALWKRVRKKVFREKGEDCCLCGAWATELHHTRYHEDDLSGKKTEEVHPVCSYCHRQVEFDGYNKRTLAKATAEFERRYAERRRQSDPFVGALEAFPCPRPSA